MSHEAHLSHLVFIVFHLICINRKLTFLVPLGRACDAPYQLRSHLYTKAHQGPCGPQQVDSGPIVALFEIIGSLPFLILIPRIM